MDSTIQTCTLRASLPIGGAAVLTYKIEYPRFGGARYRTARRRLSEHYARAAQDYAAYLEREVYPAMAARQREGAPARACEITQTYRVTYDKRCVVSLYFDRCAETGTVRTAETWNLQGLRRMTLRECFPQDGDYPAQLLAALRAQVREHPDLYRADAETRLATELDARNFYCTPEEVCVYYPPAALADGARRFSLPYSPHLRDPQRRCLLALR